jgi:tRNA (guanine37-N1)-methyltransferase
MKISIITLFPEVFEPTLNSSILKRAQTKAKISFELINLRDFGEGPHQIVDGRPYGGGAGMVFRADILTRALKSIKGPAKFKVVLTSASGIPYKQEKARELSKLDHLIIVCGHYEGVDQRFIDKYVDEEISIGDYVLTGGEIPAMAIVDSITRLIPGVLEKPEAVINESFTENLLEGPQYTRPDEFEGEKVPDVLVSGHHGEVDKWRAEKALEKTKKVHPDLLK